MHLRATLSWENESFALEESPSFDNTNMESFLLWLKDNNPRKRVEENGAIGFVRVAKSDPNYRNAVWQELDMRGFTVYPIEEYQKDFLVELNNQKFDKVRQEMMGDILVMKEEKLSDFMADLKEGVKIIRELKDLDS
jgi:pyridoxine/pyridoxamine 5'-phosphate oxidase